MTTDKRKLFGFSPTLFAAHILCLIVGTHAASVLEAYRLVQYDREGVPSGSRTVRLMQYATVKREGATLFRNVVLLPIKDATLQIVKEILDPAAGVSGLIFLLPTESSGQISVDPEIFIEVERYLLLRAVAVPVYFIKHCQEMDNILTEIEKGIDQGKPPNRLNGGRMMHIKSGMARPLKQPSLMHFEGWLHGSEGKSGKRSVRTVVISARYDAFNLVPGLPGNSNAAGATALLSLVRLFGALYKNASTRPKINLLFLLTGGTGLDFLGLQSWIASAERPILDSIEFVISLDDLSGLQADKNAFYLHYSKPPKESHIQQWYDRFETAAKDEGVSLTTLHKKINLALPYMSWEHEHLARQKLLGATLSGRRQAENPMLTASVLDGQHTVDREVVRRAIGIVGHAITSRLYQEENETMPSFSVLSRGLPGMGHGFLDAWIRSLGEMPRMAPYLMSNDPFSTALLRFLKAHVDKGTSTVTKMESKDVFYEGIVYEVGIYKAAGFLFDLILLLGVCGYLIVLFVGLRVWTQGWASLLLIFKSSESKWKKAAGNKGRKFVVAGKK